MSEKKLNKYMCMRANMFKLEGWVSEREMKCVEGSMKLVFILVECDCRFLFVGTVVA